MTRATVCVAAVLFAGAPRLADAGAQNVPCGRPFVFSGAAVNVVVLPYEAPIRGANDGLGERLSGLLQLEVLRSIAKFGSVGAVQLVGSPATCRPDEVLAKLLGREPGAQTTVRPGHGLVMVWGRFYNAGGKIFVQTFTRLVRSGVTESLELAAGKQRFVAHISAQAFAYAPRQVTESDLANFEQQFRRSTVLRSTPNESASGSQLPRDPLPYWISDLQGDWMKVTAQGGLQGWIRLSGARDPWSLVRWLPEVTYVEGIVGYLRARVPSQASLTTRSAWSAAARSALAEYEKSVPTSASPTAEGVPASQTALADAVQLQLRGILGLTKPLPTVEDRAEALRLFERSVARVPHDAKARTLRAVLQLSMALDSRHPGLSPTQAAEELFSALTSDPGNRVLLANLQSAYEALLAMSGTTQLTDEERRAIGDRLDAIRQLRTAKTG